MQRIPSGVIDQYIYFLAVDSTDLKTPETGLSSFTVYRSRNGGTATVYTTPTVSELSSSNMPGWYRLLVDEDTTIDSGDDSQVMALHITQASMAPARVLVELYRPAVTPGQQIAVSSGNAAANVTQFGGTNGTFASGIPAVNTTLIEGTDATNQIRDSVVDDATRIDASALNTLSSHDPGETIMGATDLGTGAGLTSLASATNLATVAGYIDTEVAAIKAKTDNLPSDPADASVVAGLIAAVEAKVDTVDTVVDAIKVKTDNLPTDPADQSLVIAATDALATLIGDVPTNSEFNARSLASADYATAAALATTDGVADAVKAVTDKIDTAMELDGAVYRFTTNALEQAPSGGGGGSGPTAEEIADEVQTRTIAAVTVVNGLAANTVSASALATDAVAEIQSGLATASALATVDGMVDNIVGVTEKLNDTLEDAGGGNWIFTEAALENAPAGSGGGSGPSAAEIADEVQTRTIAAVTVVNGLAANSVTAAALASDAVSEIQSGIASQSSVDEVADRATDVWRIHGLDAGNPMTVTPGSRQAGSIHQTIGGNGTTISTVTRTA